MAKKTTSAERREYIKEREIGRQRYEQGDRSYNRGGERYGQGISFIDKLTGNIVRPNKKEFEAQKARARGSYGAERKRHYDSTRTYETNSGSNRYHRHHNLAQEFYAVIAAVGALGAIFFLSPNMTGNAVANLTVQNSSFLGAGLFIVGLVAGFFYLNNRKN